MKELTINTIDGPPQDGGSSGGGNGLAHSAEEAARFAVARKFREAAHAYNAALAQPLWQARGSGHAGSRESNRALGSEADFCLLGTWRSGAPRTPTAPSGSSACSAVRRYGSSSATPRARWPTWRWHCCGSRAAKERTAAGQQHCCYTAASSAVGRTQCCQRATLSAALLLSPDSVAAQAAMAQVVAQQPSDPKPKVLQELKLTNFLRQNVLLVLCAENAVGVTLRVTEHSGSGYHSSSVMVRYTEERQIHRRAGTNTGGRWRAPETHTTTVDTSDPHEDLGITFVAGSCPPTIASVARRTMEQQARNSKLAPGMVLRAISINSDCGRYGRLDGDPAREYSVKGKTHAAVMAHIRQHKRPIALKFDLPSTADRRPIGTLRAYDDASWRGSSYIRIATLTGTRIEGEVEGEVVFSMTVKPNEKNVFMCVTEAEAAKKCSEQNWKELCEPEISAAKSRVTGCNIFSDTETDVVQRHIASVTPCPLTNCYKYRDLRVLQDSSLFGVSEGYVGEGDLSTICRTPTDMAVELRNYQLQTLQWMQDQECRRSISEPYFTLVPTATSDLRRAGATQPHEGQLWYSHVTGRLFEQLPSASIGGINATEMGMGKTVEMLALFASSLAEQRTFSSQQAATISPPVSRNGGALGDGGGGAAAAMTPKRRGGTLIICPVSLFGQWKSEIKSKLKTMPSLYEYHTGRKFDVALIAGHDVVLSTYSILNREYKGVKQSGSPVAIPCPLLEIEWYRIILDEAHAIKETTTQTAKCCQKLEARRRWAVTGTTLQTKEDDLLGMLQFLKLQPYSNSGTWRGHLYPARTAGRGALGPINTALLAKIMKHSVIRHTKHQIFDGEQILKLPSRTQVVRLLTMSADEAKLYAELERKAKCAFSKSIDVRRDTLKLMSVLQPLRMVCSHAASVQDKHITLDTNGALTEEQLRAKLMPQIDASLTDSTINTMRTLDKRCPICLDVLDAPACSSKCGHVFCLECISSVINTNAVGSDTGPCPLCRIPVALKDLIQLVRGAAAGRGRAITVPISPSQYVQESGLCSDERGALPPGWKYRDLADGRRNYNREENPTCFERPAAPTEYEELLKAVQLGVGTKLRALLGSLREMAISEPDAKAVVFTQFTSTHARIVGALQSAGVGVVQIRGNMTQKARSNALTAFMTDAKVTVFCLSLRSGAVGLTLTRASRCFLLEPCLNEGTELQAFNRIHRMGQTKSVQIVTFCIKDTIEERLLQMRKERKVERSSAVDPSRTAGGGAAAAGGRTSMDGSATRSPNVEEAMTRFNSSLKVDAKLEEWQLMFGTRAATESVDLGDPDPCGAEVAELLVNCDDDMLLRPRDNGGDPCEAKVRRPRRRRDPKLPKRPKSPYAWFATTQKRPGVTYSSKDVGARWGAMTAEQKAPFEMQSKDDRDRYIREMSAYVPDPAYAEQSASAPAPEPTRACAAAAGNAASVVDRIWTVGCNVEVQWEDGWHEGVVRTIISDDTLVIDYPESTGRDVSTLPTSSQRIRLANVEEATEKVASNPHRKRYAARKAPKSPAARGQSAQPTASMARKTRSSEVAMAANVVNVDQATPQSKEDTASKVNKNIAKQAPAPKKKRDSRMLAREKAELTSADSAGASCKRQRTTLSASTPPESGAMLSAVVGDVVAERRPKRSTKSGALAAQQSSQLPATKKTKAAKSVAKGKAKAAKTKAKAPLIEIGKHIAAVGEKVDVQVRTCTWRKMPTKLQLQLGILPLTLCMFLLAQVTLPTHSKHSD
eukprot:SAG11_NODE_135_length_15131_cov_9.906599_8_plen_1752_part_00